MEISLFSKCIKDLIVENDKVDVPYLGTFSAEMMPASYSDKQTTIHPPYRKMTFHKADISLADGSLLLEKVRRETGVSAEQASVELGWCLSRLCSELEGRKSCQLPGLGVMRANARNEFFFIPDDDLDIWPDGVGLLPISIKVSEKADMPAQAEMEEVQAPAEEAAPVVVEATPVEEVVEPVELPEEPEQAEEPASEEPEPVELPEEPQQPEERKLYFGDQDERPERPEGPNWLRIVLIAILVLAVLFIVASYLFTDEMSPILDRLLYTKEELELWKG